MNREMRCLQDYEDTKAVVETNEWKKCLNYTMARLEVVELIVAAEQCLNLIKISENKTKL